MPPPPAVTEADLVGSFMTVTLTNGTVMEGCVFTYTPQHNLLVLAQGAGTHTNPTFKIIRTMFIKDFKVEQNVKNIKAEHRLPNSVDIYETLPPLAVGAEPLEKVITKANKAAETSRSKLYADVPEGTSIAAMDVYTHIARIYPQTAWDSAAGVIVVTKDITVAGNPDWTHPQATVAAGGDADVKDRIQKLIESKK